MSTRRLSIYPNSQSFEDNLFELQRSFSSLAKNLRELDGINDSLLSFNKNFAVFLQGLSLNSERLEFPEAPNASSYALAQRPMTPPSPEPLPPIDEPAFNSNVQFQEEHDAGSAISRSRAPA
ncbi:hypothetical protein EV176_000932, partial [Coemansia sp. RSA 451]